MHDDPFVTYSFLKDQDLAVIIGFVLFLRAYESRNQKKPGQYLVIFPFDLKTWSVTQESCHFSSSSIFDWSLLVAITDDRDAN